MRILIGIDDTDTADSPIGTGKLARRFARGMNKGCRLVGVVRQQLLVDDRIPYTSHNSAACLIVDCPPDMGIDALAEDAADHLRTHFQDGSDPGLCVAAENHPRMDRLVDFGWRCTSEKVTQHDSMEAAAGFHLSGHGGTNDGIIGAAAAVGLTASGWSGRFIEWGNLRDLPLEMSVADLEGMGITVMSVDRDARIPRPQDRVQTRDWVRPRLIGNRPVLMVRPAGESLWENMGEKRNGKHDSPGPTSPGYPFSI